MICIPFFILIYKYFYIGESFSDYLFLDAGSFFGLSFETLHTVYLTMFTCFIGIYFTVLGIMMANSQIAFIDFFKFSCESDFVLFSFSIILQFMEVIFLLPLIPYVVLSEILLYIFIVCLIVFAVFSVFKMSVLQNYNRCLSLFVKKSKKGNEVKIQDFYDNFVCKCFPEKSIVILDDFYKKIKENVENNIDTVGVCLKLINSIQSDRKDVLRAKMKFLIRRIFDCSATKNYKRLSELIENNF